MTANCRSRNIASLAFVIAIVPAFAPEQLRRKVNEEFKK
jgi:hypothetical protein